MPRKKKTSLETASDPEIRAEASQEPIADVETPVSTAAEANAAPAAASGESVPAKTWVNGPLWSQTVNLSGANDGPRMRLGRDHRFQQMAIAFDVKPAAEVIQRLHDDGWKWRGAESQWTKQWDAEQRSASQLEAKAFFENLVTLERRERGANNGPSR